MFSVPSEKNVKTIMSYIYSILHTLITNYLFK